jgi:hypothetical protein
MQWCGMWAQKGSGMCRLTYLCILHYMVCVTDGGWCVMTWQCVCGRVVVSVSVCIIYSLNLDELTDSMMLGVRLKQMLGGLVGGIMRCAMGLVCRYSGTAKMYFQCMCSVCSSRHVLKRMGCVTGVGGVVYARSSCCLSSGVVNRGSRNVLV